MVRNSESECYKNLVCAIIKQAVYDLISEKTTEYAEKKRLSAKKFLYGENLDFYCGLIDLNADALRKSLSRNKIVKPSCTRRGQV